MVTETIAPGYKKTEIGIIPEDWEVKKLRDILDYEQPARYIVKSTKYDDGNEIPVLTANKAFILGYTNETEGVFTKVPVIIFDDFTTDCKFVTFPFKVKSSAIKILRVKDKSDIRFIFGKMQLVNFPLGDHKRYYLSEYQNLEISLPSPKEQAAIAQVLSDTDSLIDSLDKLIEKKKSIKQGTMQQLLTGKKRLPGFSEDWEVKKLGELGYFKGGDGFSTKYQGKREGIYPFYKVSDMNNIGNEIFMYNSNNYIDQSIQKKIKAFIFPPTTIIFAKIGEAMFLERKKILLQESCIDNNMMGFIPDNNVINPKFIYYLFTNIKFSRFVSRTALPVVNEKDIANLNIKIPKDKEEQSAIAQVLSDMDSEIERLEQKRDKYKQLKIGMMQQLLTGRIRLKW